MYYCMTGTAIQGNIPFKTNHIGPTEGRDDTEVESRERNISLYCPTRGIAILDLLYDFRVTIGTGNNERLYRHGQ